MKLKNKYRFDDQNAVFSVSDALQKECRAWGEEGVVEETRSRVDKLIELFAQTVETLVDSGVVRREDVEKILSSFEVVE